VKNDAQGQDSFFTNLVNVGSSDMLDFCK